MMGYRDRSNTRGYPSPMGAGTMKKGKLYCRGTRLPPEPVQKKGKQEDKIPEPLILALCSLSFQCLPTGRNKPVRETGVMQSGTRQDREGCHLRGQKENNKHK